MGFVTMHNAQEAAEYGAACAGFARQIHARGGVFTGIALDDEHVYIVRAGRTYRFALVPDDDGHVDHACVEADTAAMIVDDFKRGCRPVHWTERVLYYMRNNAQHGVSGVRFRALARRLEMSSIVFREGVLDLVTDGRLVLDNANDRVHLGPDFGTRIYRVDELDGPVTGWDEPLSLPDPLVWGL